MRLGKTVASRHDGLAHVLHLSPFWTILAQPLILNSPIQTAF
jgi:hypothetical protein